MVWFRVDDKFHDHRKTRTAEMEAVGLWTLAGSWCGDNLTDGFVPLSVLPRWGGRAKRAAGRLVEVGLWEVTTKDGERGYQFHEWGGWQPTREQVERERADARERMKRARARNKPRSPDERTGDVRPNVGGTNGVSSASPTRPVGSGTLVSQLESQPRDNSGDRLDLQRIAPALGGDPAHAERVARDVLGRSPKPPADPTAYVLAAIRERPADYRPTPTPPGVRNLCRDHGQDARTCVHCRQEARTA